MKRWKEIDSRYVLKKMYQQVIYCNSHNTESEITSSDIYTLNVQRHQLTRNTITAGNI